MSKPIEDRAKDVVIAETLLRDAAVLARESDVSVDTALLAIAVSGIAINLNDVNKSLMKIHNELSEMADSV